MKKTGCWVLLALAAGAGCLPIPKNSDANQPPAETSVKPRPPAPVTADQVNEANAHKMIQALTDEMDWEAREQR
jgi:hypothetical protein